MAVRSEVQQTYDASLQERLAGAVWHAGGCESWYVSADGVSRTLWPGHSYSFNSATAEFDAQNHERIPVAAGKES